MLQASYVWKLAIFLQITSLILATGLEMNNGFSVKCWQKELHQITEIECENCTLFVSNGQSFIKVWAKASKTGNAGGIDVIIVNILS